MTQLVKYLFSLQETLSLIPSSFHSPNIQKMEAEGLEIEYHPNEFQVSLGYMKPYLESESQDQKQLQFTSLNYV